MNIIDTLKKAHQSLKGNSFDEEGYCFDPDIAEIADELEDAIAELEKSDVPNTLSPKQMDENLKALIAGEQIPHLLYPAPAVPEGWMRVIDEAMVSSHLGVANASDTYGEAKKKLNDLICWNIQVATDPAANGGWQLVPIEPTTHMLVEGMIGEMDYERMLNAAPKGTS